MAVRAVQLDGQVYYQGGAAFYISVPVLYATNGLAIRVETLEEATHPYFALSSLV